MPPENMPVLRAGKQAYGALHMVEAPMMNTYEAVTCRLTGLIREVGMRGYEGRWQLRLGLEDTVAYAEYRMREGGSASGESVRAGLDCVLNGLEQALVKLYTDPKERQAMRERLSAWFKDSHEEGETEMSEYLGAIANRLARKRAA